MLEYWQILIMDIFLVAPYDKHKVALHYGHCIAHYLSTHLDVRRILVALSNKHILIAFCDKHKLPLHYRHYTAHNLSTCLNVGGILIDLNNGHISSSSF